MELEHTGQFEYILGRLSVGVAVLNCADLRFLYANAYLLSILDEPWCSQGVVGHRLDDVAPKEVQRLLLPILQQVCSTGQSRKLCGLPYEGFLKVRGRIYWRVSIELLSDFALRSVEESLGGTEISPKVEVSPAPMLMPREGEPLDGREISCGALLVTIEDETELVRSRLHLKAFQNVSAAIVGPVALPQVLDRILQAVQGMVGSRRCAVLLIDQPSSSSELPLAGWEGQMEVARYSISAPTISLAAYRGLHLRSRNWRPQVSERLLVGRVLRERRTLIVEDTRSEPGIELPLIDDNGVACRPGSVLCVPIFEPTLTSNMGESFSTNGSSPSTASMGAVLGTIEVYRRRAGGFPAEEVELLERFAQQVGLAIQHARLFRNMNHLAQVASRNARQRENIMQAIPDGVIIYDSRWHVVDVNYAARKLLGWSENVIGLHVTQALTSSRAIFQRDPRAIVDIVTEMEQAALERRVSELKMVGADSQQYTMSRSQAPIHDALGNIFAFVVIYHDVTEQAVARERIEAEVVARTAELAQRNQELESAKAASEDFFTTLAHELKTPLANIRAHLSALLAQDLEWSVKEQYDFLETADGQVERLVDMINQFLDASRVEAGVLRLELEPILLPELLEDLQDRLEALISSSQRHLEIRIPAGLPAVLADYELIISVLMNLLSNAFRYAPEGDTVRLEAEAIFSMLDRRLVGVEIRVIDRGPGMSEEQQAEIFTRFSTFAALRRPAVDRPGQAARERRRSGMRWSPATGLGLYISRGIIEAHGSTLTLKSSPGQGATFAFILPAASTSRREVR